MPNILYFGSKESYSTANHRSKAMERLGYSVDIHDPEAARPKEKQLPFSAAFHYHTGYRFLQPFYKKWVRQVIAQTPKPDLIWVNGGDLFGPGCLTLLRKLKCPVVLYNNDDPTGNRDGRRFDSLKKSIRFYDLCAVRRQVNIEEYKLHGAKNVVFVYMSYDELIHKPFPDKSAISPDFISDVAFIGTWMRHEKRDEFLLHLISKGVNVSIWGSHWSKSPHWNALQPYYRGKAIGGRDYVAAMQGAKICLGLLSKGNRDLHTRRSVEIPYAEGLLCAERTSEHQELYEEGKEAVFWDNAEECANVCIDLLANEEKREQIRLAGIRRVRQLEVGNEDVCRKILNEAFNNVK